MYNLLISIGIAAASYMVPWLIGLKPIESILPGVIGLVASYILLARRTGKKAEVIVTKVTEELTAQRYDRALALLDEAMKFGKWQFFIASQLHGTIGQILYMQKKFKEARPHLEKAHTRHWVAKGMLACCYFRDKEYDRMKKLFEAAVSASKKESMLWSVYAWCLWKTNDRDAAIAVLSRAAQATTDERIKKNLLALQNNQPMKMKAYAENWYQFMLEKMPATKVVPEGPAWGKFAGKRRFFR